MATALDDAPRTAARSVRVARAVMVALGVAFAISVLGGGGSTAAVGRLGGDYPAFHAAGEMVLAGHGRDLYDPVAQAAAQRPFYGDEHDGGYLPFAYPPAVALAYAPLAELPYRWSYVVAVGVGLGALVVALRLLGRRVAGREVDPTVLLAAVLAFFPMFRAVTAGQGTPVALLLVAVAWRAAEDRCDLAAGLALGLLAYKPQYAVVFVLVALVARRWRIVAGAAAGGALVWLASAAVAGPGWVTTWWSHAQRFAELDTQVDRANAISWAGIVHAFGGRGTAADAVVALLVLATLGTLGWVVRRAVAEQDLALAVAAAVPVALLVAPHALFYDAGLLVLAAGVVAARLGSLGRAVVAGVWVVGLGHLVADRMGLTPVALGVVVAAGAVLAAATAGPAAAPEG